MAWAGPRWQQAVSTLCTTQHLWVYNTTAIKSTNHLNEMKKPTQKQDTVLERTKESI